MWYHDGYVDRDAGILYILMEYCSSGDLSAIIKQAQKYNRLIPKDTKWNYFMQTLLALHYCHHPNGHAWSGSRVEESNGKEKRAQILHREKPDNGTSCLLPSVLFWCVLQYFSITITLSNWVTLVCPSNSHRWVSQICMLGWVLLFIILCSCWLYFSHPTVHTICPPNTCKKKPTTQNQIYGHSDA